MKLIVRTLHVNAQLLDQTTHLQVTTCVEG